MNPDDDEPTEITEEERDRALERLQEHFARSDLDIEALDSRTALVEHAATTRDLNLAFANLPSLPPPQTALVKYEATPPHLRALFSQLNRSGSWTPPAFMKVSATAGGAVLDFTEAHIEGVVELRVSAFAGSVRLIVPEGLRVDMQGAGILGSFAHLEQGAADGDRRVLKISGRAILGSVEIEVRERPGILSGIKKALFGS
jgi:hypothetical protein